MDTNEVEMGKRRHFYCIYFHHLLKNFGDYLTVILFPLNSLIDSSILLFVILWRIPSKPDDKMWRHIKLCGNVLSVFIYDHTRADVQELF